MHRLTAGCKGCIGGKRRKRCPIYTQTACLGAACLRKSFVKSGESREGERGAFNSHFFKKRGKLDVGRDLNGVSTLERII
jgi:hypothetical protein